MLIEAIEKQLAITFRLCLRLNFLIVAILHVDGNDEE